MTVLNELTPRIGTEVIVDADTLVSGGISGQIRDLLERRGVIAFPEINLTPKQQVAFTKTLGAIVDEGEDHIYKITMDRNENDKAEYLKGAFYWHIDGTMSDMPILASIMSCQKTSESGGDTQFSNTYAAYDDLPDDEKERIENIQVVHSFEASQRYVSPEPTYEELKKWQEYPDKILPLVWTHKSGRKSLVLGSTASYVVDMEPRASNALLCRLRDWATQPQFVYTHKWRTGDLVIWDNTGTMHRATLYPLDSGRMMFRNKLEGEEPVA